MTLALSMASGKLPYLKKEERGTEEADLGERHFTCFPSFRFCSPRLCLQTPTKDVSALLPSHP